MVQLIYKFCASSLQMPPSTPLLLSPLQMRRAITTSVHLDGALDSRLRGNDKGECGNDKKIGVLNIHEDLSTRSTYQSAIEVEFPNNTKVGPCSKFATIDGVEGDLGAQGRSVLNIHEDLSTKSTYQSAIEVEFPTRSVLGGKGYGLHRMSSLGLNVPAGFVIPIGTTSEDWPQLTTQLTAAIAWLEEVTEKSFGGQRPLLLSVRSGALISMPGMMDTILNLGLNDETVENLAKLTTRRFALDSYRRFLHMFSNVVLKIDTHAFELALQNIKFQARITHDYQLSEQELEALITKYKAIIRECCGHEFPQDIWEQLKMAIEAVWDSWHSDRAVSYRNHNKISGLLGTAVTVQSMVFGNLNNNSGTGVVFSRNPSTGENNLYGEFMINAQGEDVVAGIRTPIDIHASNGFAELFPDCYKELAAVVKKLEEVEKDVQDIEFTVEEGRLFILQTRSAKRSLRALIKTSYDMVLEGLITKEEAILRIPSEQIATIFCDELDIKGDAKILVQGLPASPGAAYGRIAFTQQDAKILAKEGNVILVRQETSPNDIDGIILSCGLLTVRGGITSHAAVVARGLGKPCITGIDSIIIDESAGVCRVIDREAQSEVVLSNGDLITIDGTTGAVLLGNHIKPKEAHYPELIEILAWAKAIKTMQIKANAETPTDIQNAIRFGAEAIGLCRTEHMFLTPSRLLALRKWILSIDSKQKADYLAELEELHTHDIFQILKLLEGRTISIRLLDPPLHEFLPKTPEEIAHIAHEINASADHIEHVIESKREVNPMLGLRGVRLGLMEPSIYQMQLRAIRGAMTKVPEAKVEIMVPLVAELEEMALMYKQIHQSVPNVKIGAMIELPKAALIAEKLAKFSDFFAFGTNDLTQTTLGISRDDALTLITKYRELGIFKHDPFVTLDEEGVGQLVALAIKKGNAVNSLIKMGVCGEHGGDHSSILYLQRIGCNYVSVSPFRVYGAILAAAQAVLI